MLDKITLNKLILIDHRFINVNVTDRNHFTHAININDAVTAGMPNKAPQTTT